MLHAALQRHPAAPCAPLRSVEVFLERSADGQLQVRYLLDGDLDRLRIPPRRAPRSAERLWQHTCCEIFVAREAEDAYDEYNFSPSGEWASFAFARYREGGAFPSADPRIRVGREAGRLELEARVSKRYPEKLRIGLAAVIEDADGALSYWALRHAPGKPDFHQAATFALELDEVRH